jgi:hypothetical protein
MSQPIETQPTDPASADTLAGLAVKINGCITQFEQHDGEADRLIKEAATMIAQARKQVSHGEWGKWCDANLKWKSSRVAELLKIGQAASPDAKIVELRQKGSARADKHRKSPSHNGEKKSESPPVETSERPVENERQRLIDWAQSKATKIEDIRAILQHIETLKAAA